ncbi:MAG: M23 family metallopeptidase [Parcubacteria group bacterium]
MALPIMVYAGEQVLRVPETTNVSNSQTMHLLEGYLNINPTGTGGVEIAIADGVALEYNGGEDEVFLDLGKSGTGQISIYVVRKGDTLSEIAEMFGVSTNTIIWANDLRGSTIKEGQELVILPISGVRHVVKSGDTLQSVSKKYKSDLGDILSYNGFTTDTKIKPGDIVIIPDGVISTTASAIAQSSNQLNVASGYYLRPINGGMKSQGIHGYNGVDLAPSCRCSGDPIFAAASGTVIIARTSGYNGGYGLYVAIKHANGTQTVYGHMSKVNVSVGQNVTQGQVIGAVGNTGRSTGPHLHFEVRGAKHPF